MNTQKPLSIKDRIAALQKLGVGSTATNGPPTSPRWSKPPQSQNQGAPTSKQTDNAQQSTKFAIQKMIKVTQNAVVDKESVPSQDAIKLRFEGKSKDFKKIEQLSKTATLNQLPKQATLDQLPKQAPKQVSFVQIDIKSVSAKESAIKFDYFCQEKQSKKQQNQQQKLKQQQLKQLQLKQQQLKQQQLKQLQLKQQQLKQQQAKKQQLKQQQLKQLQLKQQQLKQQQHKQQQAKKQQLKQQQLKQQQLKQQAKQQQLKQQVQQTKKEEAQRPVLKQTFSKIIEQPFEANNTQNVTSAMFSSQPLQIPTIASSNVMSLPPLGNSCESIDLKLSTPIGSQESGMEASHTLQARLQQRKQTKKSLGSDED